MSATLALTLLSAGLYAASFPPLSLAPLAWVALAPFFAAVALVRPRRAAVLGCVWGMTVAYGVAWWLPAMVSGYFEASRLVGWSVFLAISVGLAGWYFAAFAAWLSALARRGVAGPLTAAVGWGACEFARSRLLVGNPWALAGYSQVSFASLTQIADTTGPYGVGMLLAGVNAAVAAAVVPGLRGRKPLRSVIALVVALVATLAYGQWRLGQEFGTGPRLRVALVQGAVPARFRWQPEFRAASVARYLALTDQAAAGGPQLVVWPENAIDFYVQERSPEAEAVLARSRDLDADLIVNGPRYDFEGERTLYHNSVFVLRHGRIAAQHDKIRLLPVAEGEGPGGFLARDTNYSPGTRPELLEAAGVRVGSLVCFEAMYPELVRRFTDLGAELLVNVSNDVWFGAAAAARHHLDIASVRAIENRRYLLRATSTGYSAIVDPHGRILAGSPLDEPAVVSDTIQASAGRTPYQNVGDLAAWLAVLIAAGCSCRAATRRPT
jgi:apolipoprotein N-acyltransferase